MNFYKGIVLKSFDFIRHGETDWNKENIFQGHNDIPLNENGKKQAQLRANSFSLEHFSEIFTSPLKRAKETAEIIRNLNKPELNLIEISELMECRSEESARYILGLEEVTKLPSFEKIKNERESSTEFIERIQRGLQLVFNLSKSEKPLIIAHGGVCTALNLILDIEFFRASNCCLIEYHFNGKAFSNTIYNL